MSTRAASAKQASRKVPRAAHGAQRFALCHALYEAAVTNADALARFARAVHGGRPTTLREDFAGAGALARAWAGLSEPHESVSVERDAQVAAITPAHPRVRGLRADVMRCAARADIVAATNFPVCYWHTRDELIAYFRHVRRVLRPRGVFFFDLYGGDGCFTPCVQTRKVRIDAGTLDAWQQGKLAGKLPKSFEYAWEQRRADATSGLVHNAIHFRLPAARGAGLGAKPRVLRDAFTYHWRLWSIPEATDALREAGFKHVEVYSRTADAIDTDGNVYVSPLAPGDALDATWVVYVVARK